MKNYIIYSILGDIIGKHIENENEIIHHYLEITDGEKIVLFEIMSEPIVKKVK